MDKKQIENITRHSEVSEKAIERYLVERAKQSGMLCLKYSNPNMVGFPDRLLVCPRGLVVWVELKSRGCTPSRIQQERIKDLIGMNHLVMVIDSREGVDDLINRLCDVI